MVCVFSNTFFSKWKFWHFGCVALGIGIIIEAIESLVVKLDIWFPEQVMLDVMGIVYPQCWIHADVEVTFPWHLEMLKGFYYSLWPCGQSTNGNSTLVVLTILWGWDLDVHQGLFKLTMKSNATQAMVEVVAFAFNKANPIIVKPFTHLWQVIHASQF